MKPLPGKRSGKGSPLVSLDQVRRKKRAGEFLDHLKTSPFVAVVMGPAGLVVYHTANLKDVKKIRKVLDEMVG